METDIQIITMIALPSKEIARRLNFSHRTIENNIERLKKVYGARTKIQLAILSGFDIEDFILTY